MKNYKVLLVLCFAFAKAVIAQTTEDQRQTLYGVGLNAGFVIGDLEDAYSSNLGVDLYYLKQVSKRVYVGASTGFAYYLSEDNPKIDGVVIDEEDLSFIPLAGSFRIKPLPNLVIGGDIGYAIGLEEDGGFYASPRATYLIKGKFPVFLGYRLIDLDAGSLGSVQFGLGFSF